MRRLFFIIALCSCPIAAAADESAPGPLMEKRPTERTIVGQDVARFSDSANSSARNAMYFFAVLLAGFGLWKHFQQKKGVPASTMKIIGRTSVGPRAALVLAEVEGRRFLLSQTPDRLSLISELDSRAGSSANFQELLSAELEADLTASRGSVNEG